MKLAQIYHNNRLYITEVVGEELIPINYEHDTTCLIQEDQHRKKIERMKDFVIPIEEATFLPPVVRPSKIIAIGLNYLDHATEGNVEIPKTPLVFTKFSSSLVSHKRYIYWNQTITKQVDYEAELAVIIGKITQGCSVQDANDAIWGYTCANDVSARDLQFGDGQWVRGKSLDTFCPLGPWVVLKDEIESPLALDIQCRVNGQIMQQSNTNKMIFPVPELISFLSNHFTLFPGDIILTGTPDGVGAFRKPPVYLKHGDQVDVEIESIGCLSNIAFVESENNSDV
jgi:2-keto-4-pentenoate hydratase/2-oxohepta-3-ene-1,7-dioic acid hydratase in catechol pathway